MGCIASAASAAPVASAVHPTWRCPLISVLTDFPDHGGKSGGYGINPPPPPYTGVSFGLLLFRLIAERCAVHSNMCDFQVENYLKPSSYSLFFIGEAGKGFMPSAVQPQL